MADRKPPVPAQSRDPHSIRFSPQEWDAICTIARRRGEEPSRFVRKLTMYALRIVQAPAGLEDSLGITAMGGA